MARVRNSIRDAALRTLKSGGLFELVKNSRWRQQRLLIICYHGVALEDEHLWRPYLFVSPRQLEQRFEILRNGSYAVLRLGDAVEKLYKGELPPGSIALTFDDGTYDFYRQSYPQLKHYGFPATVYLTTYYSGRRYPVFGLICSYMLWKRRDLRTVYLGEVGISERFDLDTEQVRRHIVSELVAGSDRRDLSGKERDGVAAKLAGVLKIDYGELCAKRILQVMAEPEVNELSRAGVDFQLHTHRHRTPSDEGLFRREIRENREKIENYAANRGVHFCYPSGDYRAEFLPWLSAEGVVSATTCDTGLASPGSNPLLLPRLVDTTGRSELVFESWVSGVGQFLSFRKRAGSGPDPRKDGHNPR